MHLFVFDKKLLSYFILCWITHLHVIPMYKFKTRSHSVWRIEVRMIPDTCKGKVLILYKGLRMKSRYGVGLKTRIQALKCYQDIRIVNGVNARLEDLELSRNYLVWKILKEPWRDSESGSLSNIVMDSQRSFR